MLDEITVTQQPSVISVRLDGHPYLVTFTGRIGICFLGGVVMMYPESEDGSIVKVKHDHEYADRECRRADALAEAMPLAIIPRPWWHGRWPVVQHTLRTGIDYMDDLVALETERCAKMAEDEMVDADDANDDGDRAYNQACRDIALKIRKPA